MNNKKKFSIAILTAVLLVTSSFAYFTDKTQSTATGNAGILCLTEIKNEHDLSNMAPGDERTIDLQYKNEGNIPMDTRITHFISKEVNGQMVATDDFGVLTLTQDKDKLSADEILTAQAKFVLNAGLGNEEQNRKFSIKFIIEGKQELGEWTEMNTIEYEFDGHKVDVVKSSACNVVDVPETPEADSKLFEYLPMSIVDSSAPANELAISGFDEAYLNKELNGVQPLDFKFPTEHEGNLS